MPEAAIEIGREHGLVALDGQIYGIPAAATAGAAGSDSGGKPFQVEVVCLGIDIIHVDIM